MDTGAQSTNVLSGFGSNDRVELRGFAFSDVMETYTAGTLTLTDAAGSAILALPGNYGLANFTLQSDGHGGTIVKFRS